MMGLARISLITLLFCQLASAAEFAEFGVLNTTFPSTSAPGSTPGVAPGLGLSLAIDVTSRISIEPEALYLGRRFTANPGVRTSYRFNFVQIPFLVRYRLDPNIVIGGGFYYSYVVGNINTSSGSTSQVLSPGNLSLGNTDIGIIASVRYRKLIHEFIHLVVDARFNYGLTNLSKIEDQSLSFRELQLLVGIAFVL